MYHSIGNKENADRLLNHLYSHISVDSKKFEEHIEYLKKSGHTFISFKDISRIKSDNIKKPTIIYFDDGFKDVLENALPILEKNNIPATIFVVTGILDKTEMLWTILYKEALTKQNISLEKQAEMIEKIKTGTEQDRINVMNQFSLKDYQYLFDIFLSWDDLRNISKRNVHTASHSVSHMRMNELSESDFKKEIAVSKNRTEEELREKAISFSFPYGRGSEEMVKELYKTGYSYVVSKGCGINEVNETKNIYLKNISPKPNDSLMMFKLRLYSLNINK